MSAPRSFFRFSAWDALPALGGVFHVGFLFFTLFAFPILPWWALIPCGLFAALLICWNLGPASYFHLPAMSFPEALGFSGLLLGMLGVLLLLRGTDS